MKSDSFVKRLKELAPSSNDLVKLGVSEKFILDFINSFNCKIKNIGFHHDNEMIELVMKYDVTKLEIGMITFFDSVAENENYYFVGKFEQDYLCLKKKTGEIVVVDNYDKNREIYKCANFASNFLDAILLSAAFLTERLLEVTNENDSELNSIKRISLLAGGSEYENFYKTLLG